MISRLGFRSNRPLRVQSLSSSLVRAELVLKAQVSTLRRALPDEICAIAFENEPGAGRWDRCAPVSLETPLCGKIRARFYRGRGVIRDRWKWSPLAALLISFEEFFGEG